MESAIADPHHARQAGSGHSASGSVAPELALPISCSSPLAPARSEERIDGDHAIRGTGAGIDSLTRVRRAGKVRVSRLCPVIVAVRRSREPGRVRRFAEARRAVDRYRRRRSDPAMRPLIRGLDCCAARFSPLLAPASRAG
jgi:hypothetical protein